MSIKDLMIPQLMNLDLQADTKEQAIRSLIDALKKEGKIKDYDMYFNAVMIREAEYTTGIGYGVGIPHGQSDTVVEPSLCFGRIKDGIEYNSLDNKPVHLLFLIAVPKTSKDEHLKILSQLSRKLMHKEIRDALMNASSEEDVYKIFE